jgi:hypothetical protein
MPYGADQATAEGPPVSRLHFYAGLFLITACTLMLQVVQTRILSVVAWYHLAFFAISMAMFGLTAGAVWLYLTGERHSKRTLSYDLAYFSTGFAVATTLCLGVQLTLAPILNQSVTSLFTWLQLAVCLAIPFFFSGVTVGLALTRSPFPIGRVYGVDLLGAASGCLIVLVLLNVTDGPSAVLWVATMAAAAGAFFSRSGVGASPSVPYRFDSVLRHRAVIAVVLGVCAVLNGITTSGMQPLVAKGRFESGASHIFREWNTFSRVAVYREETGPPQLWGASPRFLLAPVSISQRFLNIDGDAFTVAYRFTGDLRDVDFLRYDVTTLAYHLPSRGRVAVIGVGGGRDILSAALFGSRDITGVELNPIFVRLLTDERGYADFTNLSALPGVKLVTDEGRSWFARTPSTFDLIQMSLIDTWAATGAGAFSLSENGLYTVEAWRIFLNRLTPRGVFTVSRWYEHDSGETGRMVSLAVAALLELGATAPQRHLFVASQERLATLIVGREPLSSADLEALHRAADLYEHRVLISPIRAPDSAVLASLVAAGSRAELDALGGAQALDLTPATDDRPFFFNQVPLNKPIRVARTLLSGGRSGGGVRRGNFVATAVLVLLFLISLALVIVTIVLPLRGAIREVGFRLVTIGTAYFLLIGIGFMCIEIGMLQRMSVFLGHPVYSLSVALFTLIVATGIGSLLSDWRPLDTRGRLVLWGALTVLYLVCLPYWMPGVLGAFEGGTLLTRAAVCVGVLAPAGVLMGFAFPTGMRLVSAIDPRPSPWFWGINGAAGVLASVAAVAIGIALGISVTLTVGAICYLLLIPAALALLTQAAGAAASR